MGSTTSKRRKDERKNHERRSQMSNVDSLASAHLADEVGSLKLEEQSLQHLPPSIEDWSPVEQTRDLKESSTSERYGSGHMTSADTANNTVSQREVDIFSFASKPSELTLTKQANEEHADRSVSRSQERSMREQEESPTDVVQEKPKKKKKKVVKKKKNKMRIQKSRSPSKSRPVYKSVSAPALKYSTVKPIKSFNPMSTSPKKVQKRKRRKSKVDAKKSSIAKPVNIETQDTFDSVRQRRLLTPADVFTLSSRISDYSDGEDSDIGYVRRRSLSIGRFTSSESEIDGGEEDEEMRRSLSLYPSPTPTKQTRKTRGSMPETVKSSSTKRSKTEKPHRKSSVGPSVTANNGSQKSQERFNDPKSDFISPRRSINPAKSRRIAGGRTRKGQPPSGWKPWNDPQHTNPWDTEFESDYKILEG